MGVGAYINLLVIINAHVFIAQFVSNLTHTQNNPIKLSQKQTYLLFCLICFHTSQVSSSEIRILLSKYCYNMQTDYWTDRPNERGLYAPDVVNLSVTKF